MLLNVENHSLPIRLDRYLRLLYPNLTQGLIEKNLRKGNIKVNNLKANANNRVVTGDKVFLPESLAIENTDQKNILINPAAITFSKKLLTDYLIFTHHDFYAINKPQGIAVQGGNKVKFSIDECFSYLKHSGHDLRLVHRLDQDTSGILLIARNREAAIKLTSAFEDKLIEKTYLAILEGVPRDYIGTIENELMGRSAKTKYETVRTHNDFSLVKFMPITGRTHQLRLHALDLGTYILGDKKYGPENQRVPLMLHAYQVELSSEIFGKPIKILQTPNKNFASTAAELFGIQDF